MHINRRDLLRGLGVGLAAGLAPSPAAAAELPTIPFGAVYFRKSNPAAEDWERDYGQAASDGMNAFRHWFMWSAIEVAPGEYDWADYDRQLELAAENGIRTIIGEYLAAAPQWAFRKYPHARVESADGARAAAHYTRASAVGGWPGLCLDNEDVRERATAFLKALAERYRDHPGMGGYDVWNELNHLGDAGGCWCEASAEKFRAWLRNKYGSLDAINKAWYRYSYASWEDVQIPRTIDAYPDSIDWMLFRVDNAVRLLKWRIETIRSIDPDNPITAHAIPTGVLDRVGPGTYPVFQAGKLVDVYGWSGGAVHDEAYELRWRHWCQMDLIRSASNGKPFWCAEMPSGAAWRWRAGRDLDEGRIATPSDLRLFTMMHFAGGARGVFSPRWRPLQDGPFAGSFAYYAMDGSPTDRSRAAEEMARWANADERRDLWKAKPVASDVGILVVPESQIHCYASEGSTDFYYDSITGAYRGFLFNSAQVDFVHADDLGDLGPAVETLYLPYPVMLPEAAARRLADWVAAGGTLISEGCPAYFGDRGRAGTAQPNYGLDRLFGAREEFVQFTPDLLGDLRLSFEGESAYGGVSLQTYEPTTGRAVGTYEDGRVAAVENEYGKGRTLLIGTFPGYGYARHKDEATKRFFGRLLAWSGVRRQIVSNDARIIARLQADSANGRTYLWAVNSTREPVECELTLSDRWGPFSSTKTVWGEAATIRDGRRVAVQAPARDVLVVELA